MLGPRQAVYRASSGGVEIQLRANRDAAGVVIRGPGTESRHFDIPGDQVGALTVRQAWEDSKNKNKEAFARIFTDDAIEVEEGVDCREKPSTTNQSLPKCGRKRRAIGKSLISKRRRLDKLCR